MFFIIFLSSKCWVVADIMGLNQFFCFSFFTLFEAVQTKRFTGSIIEMVPVKYIFHSLLLDAQKNDHS